MIAGISQWENNQVSNEDFFLLEQHGSQFKDLYTKARENKAKGKLNFDPETQLSPKGLSLVSALYALKDNSEAQPVIADSDKSLQHITRLMDDAPIGTSITVIFQPSNMVDRAWKNFSVFHKTVFKFEKNQNGINVINMDGVPNSEYAELCFRVIENELRKQALKKRKMATPVTFYRPDAQDFVGRQKSDYECGIFATKDARQLNRDANFSRILIKEQHAKSKFNREGAYLYKFINLPLYLKGAQSRTEQESIKQIYPTLNYHYRKHKVAYANHFAKKYNKQVKAYLARHTPEQIMHAVEYYDAGNMTYDRLVRVYGPNRFANTRARPALSLIEEVIHTTELAIQQKQLPLIQNVPFFKMIHWALLRDQNTIIAKIKELFDKAKDERFEKIQTAIHKYIHPQSSNSIKGIIKEIINCGILPIDIEDADGNTPLLLAAEQGDADLCLQLIHKGANVSMVNNEGFSALHYAIMNGMIEVWLALIDKNAPISDDFKAQQNQLMLAAENGHRDLCNVLMGMTDVKATDRYGNTALYYALTNGHLEIGLDLIDAAGFPINDLIDNKQTALCHAANKGDVKMCLALLKKADVNATNHEGKTALQLAINNGHYAVCLVLIEKGANVNIGNGDNPIQIALSRDDVKLCLMLLRNGLELNEEIIARLKAMKNTEIDEVLEVRAAAVNITALLEQSSSFMIERIKSCSTFQPRVNVYIQLKMQS